MIKLYKIKLNPNNPRIIKDDKFEKLKSSLKEFPKMMELRPIVVDKDNMVLGGNMRYRALEALGYKEVPDEWIKKADKLTDKEKRRFIVEDNTAFGEWDWDLLSNQYDFGELLEWGFNESDLNLETEEELYSKEFKLPTYEPSENKPKLNEIYDSTKTDKLIKDIEASDLPDNVKQFLIYGAHRHTVFNYSKIADFYANSDDKTKKLFEDSALVLIDFDKAIEGGFVKLTKYIEDIRKDDE